MNRNSVSNAIGWMWSVAFFFKWKTMKTTAFELGFDILKKKKKIARVTQKKKYFFENM